MHLLLRVVALLSLSFALPLCAHAADYSEARAHFEKGNAAYALGDYAAAAAEYERAFQLKPDPALLYNAAQSHRVAGNKTRALLLYQNYLRVYGSVVQNGEEVQRHIDTLRKAIESDQNAQTSPPTAPMVQQPTVTPPPRVPQETAAPVLVAAAPQRDERPLVKKPWFWIATGAAVVVVAGVAIGLGVGLSGTKNPTPSLGAVAGN